jgi:hypothetical protein
MKSIVVRLTFLCQIDHVLLSIASNHRFVAKTKPPNRSLQSEAREVDQMKNGIGSRHTGSLVLHGIPALAERRKGLLCSA